MTKKHFCLFCILAILLFLTIAPFSTSASPDLQTPTLSGIDPIPTPAIQPNDSKITFHDLPARSTDIRHWAENKRFLVNPEDIDWHEIARRKPEGLIENAENREMNTSQPLTVSPSAASGIYGRVTQNGSSASGVSLQLRFYNGSWSTQATTSTDSGGNFQFTGAPSLTAGQEYYVRYLNQSVNDTRLSFWSTPSLYEYTAGSNVYISDFDIANISLGSPAPGTTVSLPYTFQWTRRTATPSDVYEIDLFDSVDNDPYWWAVVGYVGSHRLYCLPPGFNPDIIYGWGMVVHSPDGGYGYSYYYHDVFFSNNPACNGIRGRVTQNGTNLAGLPVPLFLYNGTSFFIAGGLYTAIDGTFKFTNLPSLGSGSEYWVQYINSEKTSGRLAGWSTRSLTSYTPNSDVQIGDFDIADIPLVSPTDGVTETLPMTFTWSVRPSTPTDSYSVAIGQEEILLFGGGGYTNTYTLKCMFPVIETGNSYKWDLWAFSPDGGFGESLNYRSISFSGGPDCLKTFLPVALR